MKIYKSKVEGREPKASRLGGNFIPRPSTFVSRRFFGPRPSSLDFRPVRGFTMVEIAICLAIIGIALVAIIGVLPIGMNTQRDNREETIINQDATVLMEAIRSGSRGLDDLTNYVYAITNYWTKFNRDGSVNGNAGNINGYTTNVTIAPNYYYLSGDPLTNGMNIIGLLSTPEYTDDSGYPTNNLFNGGYSNHIVAYVRSLSGPAVEKPPQDNDILRNDSFSYRVLCVNAPVAVDTNTFLCRLTTQHTFTTSSWPPTCTKCA